MQKIIVQYRNIDLGVLPSRWMMFAQQLREIVSRGWQRRWLVARRWLRRDTCERTMFEESDRQPSRFKEPFRWWMLPQSVRYFHDSSRVTFSKAIEFTSVSSFLLSPVIGQSQLEDAEDLWLLRSKVRIDSVIPLRKIHTAEGKYPQTNNQTADLDLYY